MRGPHNFLRLVRTAATFERTGAMGTLFVMLEAPLTVRAAGRVIGWPFRWLGHRGDPANPPLVRALTALGPAYIKFGQLLATRPDIVGPELSSELSVLLDRLPPFPEAQAKAEIHRQLGSDVDALYSEFSAPVAAASIAQVHRARVRLTGREVAVKILRPDIERIFQKDIDAFHLSARVIEWFLPATRRLRPTDVVTHFETVVLAELDFRMEAAAAAEYAANTKGDDDFSVPAVIWELSARRVLTLDWVDGIPLNDVDALRKSHINLEALAVRVVRSFLLHVLRDGLFHADMHQGNVMVQPDGSLVAYDFGIMGRIDDYTRRVYAEILAGFISRDYKRVARVHFEAGYVPRDQDIEAFAQALRSIGEPIFGQDAAHISMSRLLTHLFDVTERFGMETRTELILLQKTMVVVEGVARTLDPGLNIWDTAKPVVERYVVENLGPRAFIRDFRRTFEIMSRFGPRLPGLIESLLNAERDHQVMTPPPRRLAAFVWFLAGAAVTALVLSAVVLSSALLTGRLL